MLHLTPALALLLCACPGSIEIVDTGCVPEAEIPYDGVNQDCDGADLVDVDGDGHDFPEDCDDEDASVHPGAEDVPYDGIDQDCLDGDLVDVDHDLFPAVEAGGSDCDDTDADIHPGAAEVCNGRDDDCDEEVDEGLLFSVWADADGDGYGDPETEAVVCEQPAGTVLDGSDCDDTNDAIHPGAPEVCNALVDDCDGLADQMVAGSTHATVQEALDAACAEGDTVWVAPGTYSESVVFPDIDLALVSLDGPELTILERGPCSDTATCPIITIRGERDPELTRLEGLTITGGDADYGAGLFLDWGAPYQSPSVTVDDCVFEDNTADVGGAISAYAAEDLRIYDSVFTGNVGPGEGGAISAQGGTVEISGCTFSDNQTSDVGGAVVVGGELTIDSNTFESNDGGRFGGGIAVFITGSCRGQITNNTFTDHFASEGGGAIAYDDGYKGVMGQGNTFSGNTPEDYAVIQY